MEEIKEMEKLERELDSFAEKYASKNNEENGVKLYLLLEKLEKLNKDRTPRTPKENEENTTVKSDTPPSGNSSDDKKEKIKESISKSKRDKKTAEESVTFKSDTSPSGNSSDYKMEEIKKKFSEIKSGLKKSIESVSESRKFINKIGETAEKITTLASDTPSSGNPSYEKYEELSRPLDSGVAGLSSSSKTPGQKTKESDSLFKDNELAEALEEMFSEDESEKTALPKKEGVVSGSENQNEKNGKWREFASNKTLQNGSISNEL